MTQSTASSSDEDFALDPGVTVRFGTFLGLTVGLLVIYAFAINSSWRGDAGIHSGMEQVAAAVALITGSLALIRFYARKKRAFLFLGTGFIGTALLDGYHAVVTSGFFDHAWPSAPPSLIPWSWHASRMYLAAMLALCVWVWEHETTEETRLPDRYVYWVTGLLALLSFSVFAFVPLPNAYYPDLFFRRPQELLSASIFAVALCYGAWRGHWRRGFIEYTLALALLLSIVAQGVFMSRSSGLFDAMFDVAHVLKILSYGLILVGLEWDIYAVSRQAERTARAEALAHEELSGVVEELQAANHELDSFVHLASHDLQEPLRNLVTYSGFLVENSGGKLPAAASQDLDFIVTAATRMRGLLQDLLTMSQVRRLRLHIEEVRLDGCVDDALRVLRQGLNECGARIKRTPLPIVQGDRVLLTNVFVHLLSNAVKFRSGDEPIIEVTVEQQDEEWVLGVKDDGIGLDPAFGDQIFSPFERLHGRNRYEGSGMGLTICRKAIERHRGVIWVESQPDEGAHFRFSLPPRYEASQTTPFAPMSIPA